MNRPARTKVRVVSSLADISRADWDAVANPGWPNDGPIAASRVEGDCDDGAAPVTTLTQRSFNPFISHDFLWSMEEAGCAVAATGWQGQHIVLDGDDARPAAIMPCYLKAHSQGEYVFDHGWADAYSRAGGR